MKKTVVCMLIAAMTMGSMVTPVFADGDGDATHIYVLTAPEDHGWTGSVATFAKEKIEEVNDDVLKKWYTGLHGIILPIDDEVQENVKKVVTSNPQLIDFKQIKSSGDAFLIATAMKYGLTIITEESKKGEKKIPYVCQKLNVPCVDILGLCEKEKWQF